MLVGTDLTSQGVLNPATTGVRPHAPMPSALPRLPQAQQITVGS